LACSFALIAKDVIGIADVARCQEMWGNGIALPCAVFVLGRIAHVFRKEAEQYGAM